MTQTFHFDRLRELISKYPTANLYPCIADLSENGVDLSRFESESKRPCRQDVTQYLAAWFRDSGISKDDCQIWMMEYCTEVLSRISSSSKSAIRHSTKSNIKYAYKANSTFRCEKETNPFRAHCTSTCPNYNQVIEEVTASVQVFSTPLAANIPPGGLKAQYKEQFTKATELIGQLKQAGRSIDQISQQLNEDSFKTKTGKAWTESLVSLEIRKIRCHEQNQPVDENDEGVLGSAKE